MIEKHWIKNLAQAKLENEIWVLADPEESRAAAEANLANIIPNLVLELADSALIFNQYKSQEPLLRVLPIIEPGENAPNGLMLFLGIAKVSLTQKGSVLETKTIVVKDYKHATLRTGVLKPTFDSFGGIKWRSQNESLLTTEELIKTLMREVCRAANTEI